MKFNFPRMKWIVERMCSAVLFPVSILQVVISPTLCANDARRSIKGNRFHDSAYKKSFDIMLAIYVCFLAMFVFCEGNKYSWVKKLEDKDKCWGCHILDRQFSSLSIFCDKCIEPVERQFRKIEACDKCAHSGVMLGRRDHCHTCQAKLKEYLVKSEKRSRW